MRPYARALSYLLHHYQPASWFCGADVVSNGTLYVATRVDPLLLVLPTLDAPAQRAVLDDERRFGDVGDVFAGDASLVSLFQLPHCDLQHVCDVKGAMME